MNSEQAMKSTHTADAVQQYYFKTGTLPDFVNSMVPDLLRILISQCAEVSTGLRDKLEDLISKKS